MMKAIVTLLAALAFFASARPAAAQSSTITIGLYAPTAPFEGTGDRVTFINALADHLSKEAGGAKVTGKVYSSAGSFAAAAKKGEIQFAVVDAPYAAALGLPWKILGSAVRGGDSTAAWQVVGSSNINKLSDLKGKKVVVPSIGAKEGAFVTNVLLDGEVEASYFDKILEAADARSAVTMVSVGKADAAFVPAGVDLPGGVHAIMSLGQVGWPAFVALPSADEARTKAFGARVKSFSGSGAFSGFTGGDAGRYRNLAGSFGRGTKKGPMAVPPPARLTVRDILEGRAFAIPLSNVLDLVEAPAKPSATARK
jgi:hypothetical protein